MTRAQKRHAIFSLRTAEAARIAGVTPSTLRSYGERYGWPRYERTPGHHRRYSRHDAVALRRAFDERLSGIAAVERAQELRASGALLEDKSLRYRMARIETELRNLREVMEHIARRLGL